MSGSGTNREFYSGAFRFALCHRGAILFKLAVPPVAGTRERGKRKLHPRNCTRTRHI